jgi:hypothetical protein
VTVLGEFSPNEWLFTLSSFFLIIEVIVVFTVSTVKVVYYFWRKMGWATFWANFSQTHLVALGPCQTQSFCQDFLVESNIGQTLRATGFPDRIFSHKSRICVYFGGPWNVSKMMAYCMAIWNILLLFILW